MPEILGAHHTSFTVAAIDKSVDFFRDLLGFELLYLREVRQDYFGRIVGFPGCVVRAAMLKVPGSSYLVELFQYLEPAGVAVEARPCDPGSCHLALVTDNLPELYARLCSRGVPFQSEPVLITAGPNAGGYGVYLRDPNGILVEFFQPPRRPAT